MVLCPKTDNELKVVILPPIEIDELVVIVLVKISFDIDSVPFNVWLPKIESELDKVVVPKTDKLDASIIEPDKLNSEIDNDLALILSET